MPKKIEILFTHLFPVKVFLHFAFFKLFLSTGVKPTIPAGAAILPLFRAQRI
ncbi:MAG: hypothetical protein QG552_2199 [Thermodesulfobacteriota bacterium]|nr:hypothetical protein [Thermodesulfobacteriota bacterium]